MKSSLLALILICLIGSCSIPSITKAVEVNYPETSNRIHSSANAQYFIDLKNGSDENSGTSASSPWKSFKNINNLILGKGTSIKIMEPGTIDKSLLLVGHGTEEQPIILDFAPGQYFFEPKHAYKSTFHISNTNDAPDSLKAVAFYFLDSEFIHLNGNGAEVVMMGKAMETCINKSNNIHIKNLSFDYHRPTVSEMTVVNLNAKHADVKIHQDSKYKIIDSNLVWIGDGWEHPAMRLWQEYDVQSRSVKRLVLPSDLMKFSEIDSNHVRIHFNKNPGIKLNMTYQNRNTFRDYAAFFINKSQNIYLKNINIYFMHGMGVVSQFSENIVMDSLQVKPKEGSGRTCAAWADILHFSSCKGHIKIQNSYLSAANDDALNVHGTHLRIVKVLDNNKINVRFMHPQTFGFEAFYEGDSIEFINAETLLPYSKNKVEQARMLSEKEMELTLSQDIPRDIGNEDVLENITWTPNLSIKNCEIAYIPTRGILVSTRGEVKIENNIFSSPHMSGILITDDANNWYESGYVRNVTIEKNKFMNCGSPVINIHPENNKIIDKQPVQKNIKITNNEFIIEANKRVLHGKSTGNLEFSQNNIMTESNINTANLIQLESCTDTKVQANLLNGHLLSENNK